MDNRYLVTSLVVLLTASLSKAVIAEPITLDLAGPKNQELSAKVGSKHEFQLKHALTSATYTISIDDGNHGHSLTADDSDSFTVTNPVCPEFTDVLEAQISEASLKVQLAATEKQAKERGPACEAEATSIKKSTTRKLVVNCNLHNPCPTFNRWEKMTVTVQRQQPAAATWKFTITAGSELEINLANQASNFKIDPHKLYEIKLEPKGQELSLKHGKPFRGKNKYKCKEAPSNVDKETLKSLGINCDTHDGTNPLVVLKPGKFVKLIVKDGTNRVITIASGTAAVTPKDIRDLEDGLAAVKKKSAGQPAFKWADTLEKSLKVYKTEYEKNINFTGTVNVGFDGDATGNDIETGVSDSKFELELGFDFSRGLYPHQFEVNTAFSLTSAEDKRLDDTVSNVSFSYDYYLKPWLEVFGFLNRTSDTYLSIDERYETGTGLKFEWKWGWLNRTGRDKDVEISKMENACTLKNAACDAGMAKIFDKLPDDDMTQLLKHQHTKLELGFLFGLFAEVEDPGELSINIQATDPMTMVTTMGSLARTPESSRRFRYEIRPSFVWRISSKVTAKGGIYYKWALDSPFKPYDDEAVCNDPALSTLCDRDQDLHRHGFLKLRYDIADEGLTTLNLEFNWYLDDTPPRVILSPADVATLMIAYPGAMPCNNLAGDDPVAGVIGCIPRVLQAEGHHRVIKFTVARKFQ